MLRTRLAICFVSVGMVLGVHASNAAAPKKPELKHHYLMKGQTLASNPNVARLVAARKEAENEMQGVIPESLLTDSSTGWTAKHTIYVACSNRGLDHNYATIQGAVAAALPFTVIKVCPGQYQAGGPDNGITIATSYIAIEGVSAHSGAQTLVCGNTPNPEDLSWGFWLLGSHDSVENMTIEDCAFGVESGDVTEVKNNTIANNWFNGDYESISTYLGYSNKIEKNHISDSAYPILSYAGIKDVIAGNHVEADGTFTQDGIAIALSVDSVIENNTVTGSAYGLDFGATTLGVVDGLNSEDRVSGNHFDGNGIGVNIVNNNSGNKFSCNYVNGNGLGFYSDSTSGAVAVPDSGANRFEKNHAVGNTQYDYVDATYVYSGADPRTNSGTADYYKGNKGGYSLPSSILE